MTSGARPVQHDRGWCCQFFVESGKSRLVVDARARNEYCHRVPLRMDTVAGVADIAEDTGTSAPGSTIIVRSLSDGRSLKCRTLTRTGCALPPRSGRMRAVRVTTHTASQQWRTRVHSVLPSSPVSTSPGIRTYLPRPGALTRYNGCLLRSRSRGNGGHVF